MQTLVELPGWLVLGTMLGLVLTVVAAGVFVVVGRAYPTRPSTGSTRSGDVRRRTEIRQYLTRIDEQFAEDHPVDGYTVEFYLPTRDVAITFDPRVFYGLTHSSTEAVLVEHEMPGRYLGSRLPFETPEVEFGPDDAGRRRYVDDAEAAFAVLGLPASASEAEVKTAYRQKAKATHPDNGGDPEAFKRLADAYATARERAAS